MTGSPFRFSPLMAQGEDGPPIENVTGDLIRFEEEGTVFEGIGGNTSILDPLELQAEISQLKHQLQKANEECGDLKRQNSCYQDENMVLTGQKESLERTLLKRGVAQDHSKQLQKELEEARSVIVSLEEMNSVQKDRIRRLEKDLFQLYLKKSDIKREYDAAIADVEKYYRMFTQADSELDQLREASEDVIDDWAEKVRNLEIQIDELSKTIEDVTARNMQLRQEKQELENNLVDMSGNHLAQLNQGICSASDQDSFNTSSPGSQMLANSRIAEMSPSTPRNATGILRRSLQAEIAATLGSSPWDTFDDLDDEPCTPIVEKPQATSHPMFQLQPKPKNPNHPKKNVQFQDELPPCPPYNLLQPLGITGANPQLFWFWRTSKPSWSGIKQISLLIILIILLMIIRIFRTELSKGSGNCDVTPILDLCSVFSKHGHLVHQSLPSI